MADFVEVLARRRVHLGFLTAAMTLVLARPTPKSWIVGLAVALAGELVRIWAAGHLEKSREVTRSGPYRFTRHPLYAGSAVIALGIVLASRSWIVATLAAVYIVATTAAAIRTEEAFLRRTFGRAYDEYRESRGEAPRRPFSFARVMRNREYRSVAGLSAGFALLALKMYVSI
jgi:protein-S-isoprenylcysteine O-methyltransferase Ste14